MSHVIIRGANMRRHEVDFGDDEISVSLHAGSETIKLVVEADQDDRPGGRRRFVPVNILRDLFSKAIADQVKKTRAR